jgi:hypothetical protein
MSPSPPARQEVDDKNKDGGEEPAEYGNGEGHEGQLGWHPVLWLRWGAMRRVRTTESDAAAGMGVWLDRDDKGLLVLDQILSPKRTIGRA